MKDILIFIFITLVFTSCIEFKQTALYDQELAPPKLQKPKKIGFIVEPVIFKDDDADLWGMEETVCKTAQLTDKVVYEGRTAIQVSWDRNKPDCEWAGFGIGWDGYSGKDLAPIVPYTAIQMHVRTKEGRMFGLPVVLTLEDYSGVMSFSYTGNKYFERPFIDEEWQKVIVPLNTFNDEGKGINLSNIKQLQVELQQSGEVYFDDFELIFYEEQPQEPWLVEPKRPNPTQFPITIFDETFINDHGWGFFADECQDIRIEKDKASNSNVIKARWDETKGDYCPQLGFGASWHFWNPVDLTPAVEKSFIQFDIKSSESLSSLPVQVGFRDYNKVFSGVSLGSAEVSVKDKNTGWKTVKIPISAIQGPANMANVKHLEFSLKGKGEIVVDNIELL